MKITTVLQDLAVPVGELVPHPDNPRLGDVGAISLSLERFGQLKPIVVNSDGLVIAGNHTYKAAVSIGATEIAVVREDDLSDAELEAFMLADNQLSDLATYDNSKLLEQMTKEYDRTGPAGLASVGYDEEMLFELTQEVHDAESGFRTADERYTPEWLFEVMDVTFTVDLAAPPDGVKWIPAPKWYHLDDNALDHDWTGETAWCNPPFSMASTFGRKYLEEVDDGVWLGPVAHGSEYAIELMRKAECVWLPRSIDFHLEGADPEGIGFPIFCAGFGASAVGVERLGEDHGNGVLLAAV